MSRMSKDQKKEIEIKKAIELIDQYLGKSDWKVKENSNMGYSLQGLNNYIASEMTKLYWLYSVYDKHIRDAHESGEINIHDSGSLSSYCAGWDLWDLLEQGFCGVSGKVESGPPAHFSSALGQINNFIFSLQGECYSDDTEVLTKEGWKFFKDLNGNEEFLTINMNNKKMEYQNAINYFKYWREEDLINFKNKMLDILVTKEHNMLVSQYSPHKKMIDYKMKLVKANEFNCTTNFIPKSGIWDGEYVEFFNLPSIKINKYYGITKEWKECVIPEKKINMNTWLKFLGIYLSEGGQYSRSGLDKRRNQPRKEYVTRVSQKKYYKEFKEVFDELGFNYSESKNKKNGITNFTISNKQLYEYMHTLGSIKEKFIPDYIKNMCKDQQSIFFKYLMLGDGSTSINRVQDRYYTSSTKLANDVQELCLKMGFNANIYTKKRDKYTWFVVGLTKSKYFRINKRSVKNIPYKGYVYCVEVPNHTLYIRRNGKATWCGNCAGAQAFSSFDTLLAPLIRRDKLTYSQIKQNIQEFVFNLNIATRSGFQTPFSNLTFDLTVSPNYAEFPIIINGQTDWYLDEHDKIVKKENGGIKPAQYKYFQHEMDLINKAFCEVMMEGDCKGRIMTFPIPTYNITRDFDWDNSKMKPLFEMSAKYGISYFSNFINSDMKPEDARSMCCFHEDMEVTVMENDQHKNIKFKDLVDNNFKVKSKSGNWVDAKKVEILYREDFYKIKLINSEIVCTDDHIHLLDNSVEKLSKTLEIGDVLFSHCFNGEIKEIERIENKVGKAYCVEVLDLKDGPYFSLSNGVITHNCRLRLDNRELQKRGGGLFSSNPMTGSIGVVTINLPRIGFKNKNNEKGYFKELDRLLNLARRSLIRKRELIEKRTDLGLYPYTMHYLKKIKKSKGQYWANHFSTIGILGMHESCLNMFGEGIETEKGKEFAIKVLMYIREKIYKFQEEDNGLYNLEATPGEGTTFRFAKKDREEFGKDIIISGDSRSYYTNSTNLPVDYDGDIFDVLDHQDELQSLYTGGTTIHLYLGQRIDNIETCKRLVKKIAENFKLPYFTLSPVFSVCPDHGYIAGEHYKCPNCKGE